MQVYSPGGRRMLPAVCLGSRPAFLASDTGWKLMAVSQMGSLQLWDLKEQGLIGEGSLEPLLQGCAPHVTGMSLQVHAILLFLFSALLYIKSRVA